jgi:hypothetical protein
MYLQPLRDQRESFLCLPSAVNDDPRNAIAELKADVVLGGGVRRSARHRGNPDNVDR